MSTKSTHHQSRSTVENPAPDVEPSAVELPPLGSEARAEADRRFIEDGFQVAAELKRSADAAKQAAEQLHHAMAEARKVFQEANEAITDQRGLLAEMRATIREYERLLNGHYCN